MIVIQDAAYRGTIIQFHCLGGVVGWDRVGLGSLALGLGKRGLRRAPLCGEDLPFDRPQPPHFAPHLYLRTAVRVEDGLGDIA